jgi:hypothetical protein
MYIIDLELPRPKFRPFLTKQNYANEKSKEILVLPTLKAKKISQKSIKVKGCV